MCSIIGYKGKFKSDVVNRLLDNSRIRGLHSFGYAFYDNGTLVNKKYLDYQLFKKGLLSDKPNLFIGHFRYSTSGDFNDPDNNQPLYCEDVALAFNGVISQKTKPEMEKEYNMSLKSDNDGYILLSKYNDKDFISNPNISFAMVCLRDNKLLALRNPNRPLHQFENPEITVFASTKDILNRSGLNNTVELKPYIQYVI